MKRQDRNAGPFRPAKLLGWALAMSLLFGLIGAGEYVEDRLRIVRNHINEKPVSGQIVLVAVDEKSLRDVGRWPWPRSRYAQLVEAIEKAKPKKQVHDWLFSERTTAREDKRLEQAFASSGDVTVGYLPRVGPQQGSRTEIGALPEFERHVKLASTGMYYNYANEVWRLPGGARYGSTVIPSMAMALASVEKPTTDEFRVDYSYSPESIPVVSASDVMAGRIPATMLTGKTAVIAPVSNRLGDQWNVPGWGRISGVYIHMIGAETMLDGAPVDFGWIPAFLLAAATLLLTARLGPTTQLAAISATLAVLITAPLVSERSQIFFDITPGMFALLWVAVGIVIEQARRRGLTNVVSGLPNLTALRRSRGERNRPLVVARVINYPQIVSTLTIAQEKALVGQITSRLRVGSEVSTIYQGDEGIFAWTVPSTTAIGHHIEALHALFRSPAKVDRRPFDIAISFGVEIGSGRTLANRLQSALVAADEASSEGLRWKYHDPERLKDVDWRLSLLSQLDDAIDHGQVWVAFQPQLDLRTNLIRGAEALARWTHPEKGPISPVEFVTAAEQSDRIEKLTMFVLDKAVAEAARINREYGDFDMAVNLSARMLTDKSLLSKVKEVLDRHGLDPARLTLELTETAAMASGSGTAPLFGLRDLGVNISIDDYGTGLSTLEYLKKIPAGEIKIDQGFVKSMRDHRSDLVMVQSTIALAHSLGRRVVAEGVETRELLDMLVAMKCEVAQGFVVGRPSSVNDLTKRLLAERKRRVA
ncbi:EAL domain-containing protein [Sphingomonas xanthus]|nr:EAL domain-containing protein [Sphingomonas xanthus]